MNSFQIILSVVIGLGIYKIVHYFFVKVQKLLRLKTILANQQKQIREEAVELQETFENVAQWKEEQENEVGAQYESLEDYRIDLEKKTWEVNEKEQRLRDLIDQNTKILKSNELFLFMIKESTLNTIKDHKRLCRMLGNVLTQDYSYDKVHEMLIGAQLKVIDLEHYFTNTFHMTPEQYKASKGKVPKTDFSLN